MVNIDEGAVKVIEIIGVSQSGFGDAVQQAVKKAAQSVSGITGVEVIKQSARVDKGQIVQYRAAVKIAFVVK